MIDITPSLDLPLEPQVQLAVEALLKGKLCIFPTETVYGLAADADNDEAIEKLLNLKGERGNKPLAIMLPDLESVLPYAELGSAKALAEDYWPGPLTLVLPSKIPLSEACTSDPWVGIRCPNHPIALAILRGVARPLAVSSANVSGHAPATNSVELRRLFQGREEDIAFRIFQTQPTESLPSTVLKIEDKCWLLLREGRITEKHLKAYLPHGVALERA